ncbi:hypothetical protein DFO52_11310 [Enterobacter sp. AG326]|nr:hypothetical protein DFO52_11310 [Enterobacter sp. AG326]
MEAYDIKKMKDLEDENRRLKQMFADLSLDCRALKDVILNNLTPEEYRLMAEKPETSKIAWN